MAYEEEINKLKAKANIMISALDEIQNIPAYRFSEVQGTARLALASITLIDSIGAKENRRDAVRDLSSERRMLRDRN